MKISTLRDLFAQAIYEACTDSRGYKYLLFADKTKKDNGNDMSTEDVKYEDCTQKIKETIDTWIAIYNTKRNTDKISCKNGDLCRVDSYTVPSGNIAKLLNFSGKVGLTSDGAACEQYIFERKLEALPATDKLKIVDSETLKVYYKNFSQFMKFDNVAVSKKHGELKEFPAFNGDKNLVHVNGLEDENGYSYELVKLIEFKNPFVVTYDKITNQSVTIKGITLVSHLAQSLNKAD